VNSARAEKRHVDFIDPTLRDGQQSWWGMRMPGAVSLALDLDRAGYRVIDIAGSSIFEVQVRYCREDPWENLRRLAAALPRTPIRAGTRSNGIVTFHVTPDSVMDLWVERLAANGIRSFWIYDGLFNVDKIGRLAKVAKRAGCEVVPTVLYSSSPYHTDAYYADRARELAALEVDAIEIEDASGVLTRDRTRGLRRAVKQAGDLRLELHFHNNTGLAPLNYLEGLAEGADTIHTASGPLANGVAHPSTEAMVRNVECSGYATSVALSVVHEVSKKLHAIAEQEGLPIGQPAEYDVFHYQHQLPGGMTGTLKNQLKERGIEAELPAIVEEIGRRSATRWAIGDGDAVLAADRHAGGAEPLEQAALSDRARRDHHLRPRSLREARRTARRQREGQSALVSARQGVQQLAAAAAGDRRAAEAIRRMGLGRRADPSALGSREGDRSDARGGAAGA
jgi:oxaloacetate decarboxylase alpha subunit